MNPASIKVQPKHLQGQLIELSFKCQGKKKLYFKVQGKAVNLEGLIDLPIIIIIIYNYYYILL